MNILFVGGNGHHYLMRTVKEEAAQAVGCACDGVDAEASANLPGRFDTDVPFFDDYHAAMDKLPIDAVSVGAVYAHNGEVVRAALKRGLKVVSDKPIATTWEQLAKIEALCTQKECTLLTEFDLRSRVNFRAAQQAIKQGLIGEPVMASAQKSYRFGQQRPWFYKDRAKYGGTLLWIASHGIDAVRFATGLELTTTCGHQGNVSKADYNDMEDHVAVCFAMSNGGSALVHADFLRPAAAPTHGDDRLRVVGAEGLVECRDDVCTLITNDAEARDITAMGSTANVGQDLMNALNGDQTYYNTVESLRMARVLLASRDAADQSDVREIPED